MVFPVVGGNESKGYEISNSLRFNDGDSASLARTPSSEGNRDTFTISFWLKRSVLGTRQFIINSWGGSTNDYAQIEINTSDKIIIQNIVSNSQQLDLRTNRVFRDPSAWYHIVLAVDSTQGTASNRAKFYVNGVQETSFSTETYMSQNNDTYFNDDVAHYIGKRGDDSNYLDGYLTEFHMVDGAAKAPTDFGEFDDNAVWIPKKYTGTYGTNGFFLQFKQTGTSANASGIGADTSGNTHHWTPDNLAALDVTEDTCTNNFATFNPLIRGAYTLSEGNCKITGGSSETIDNSGVATISMDSGKFYCEMKPTDVGGDPNFGIIEIDGWNQGSNSLAFNGYFYKKSGQKIPYAGSGGSNADYGSAISANDIVSLLYDADNGTLSFYLNGSSQGDAFTSIDTSKTWTFITWDNTTTGRSIVEANFGNPSFSISSGNTDGKYGNFEYAPPSGYYALCTKRLAEFG